MLQKCPDLSAYVIEEMKLLQEEIIALDKVTVKLEAEISAAMKIKGQCCHDKFSLVTSSLSGRSGGVRHDLQCPMG